MELMKLNSKWEDDICYECTGYGDDYSLDENGELQCNCFECSYYNFDWGE